MTNQFDNISSAELADEYGKLKGHADAIEARLAAIKAELLARNAEYVEGPKFTVTVSKSTRVSYDDKAIREALGAETVESYKRTSETVTLRVKATVIFGEAA